MKEIFHELYQEEPDLHLSTHGRVNLIGEHTDYNQGFVLPTQIPQTTRLWLRAREGRTVHLASVNQSAARRPPLFSYELGTEERQGLWTDYVKGVTWTLARHGHSLGGFDLLISSDVPMGSGLSSSAALGVAVLKGLTRLFRLDLTDLQTALLAQESENDFVGARVGIMDPLVVSVGRFGQALFVDTRSLEFHHIDLPLSDMDLLVVNSGVAHRNNSGGYNQRREECEEACRRLGISSLRELEIPDLPRLEELPPPFRSRARHVVTENARVLEAVESLGAKDFPRLGELFRQSHDSMRDDYEVSVPEIDFLVDRAFEDNRVHGARLTGGGFGGSIVALTQPGTALEVGKSLKELYRRQTGLEASVLVPPPQE